MINKIKNNKYNQGQIAIIVLLASAILLTLGLSSSRKTITDTKVDIDEELLKEAFNTAESGLNNYLNVGISSYDPGDGSKAIVSSLPIGNASSLSSEGQVPVNTPQLFWLVSHKGNGDVGSTYYTSDFKIEADAGLNNVALKVDYFFLTAGDVYSVSRFGCYTGSNTAFAGFTGDCSNITKGTNKPLLVVVTPLGGPTNITISGSSNFPQQGEELTSVGTANNGVKTQVKTRNIYQLPNFFFESITAQNEIK